jgi:hypothetical protein
MTDIFDDAIGDLLADEDMSVEAVYQPTLGSPVPGRVFMDQEIVPDPGGFDANSWIRKKTIEGRLSVFGKEPDAGETFTINGTVYTVTRDEPDNDGITFKVIVK